MRLPDSLDELALVMGLSAGVACVTATLLTLALHWLAP